MPVRIDGVLECLGRREAGCYRLVILRRRDESDAELAVVIQSRRSLNVDRLVASFQGQRYRLASAILYSANELVPPTEVLLDRMGVECHYLIATFHSGLPSCAFPPD